MMSLRLLVAALLLGSAVAEDEAAILADQAATSEVSSEELSVP